MSDALSQIPEAVAAASILLAVYYLGRRAEGQSHPGSWPGRRQAHGTKVKRDNDFHDDAHCGVKITKGKRS